MRSFRPIAPTLGTAVDSHLLVELLNVSTSLLLAPVKSVSVKAFNVVEPPPPPEPVTNVPPAVVPSPAYSNLVSVV